VQHLLQTKKIFISIPSYEDETLVDTIKDAIRKAEFPDRIVFGIALQYKEIEEPDLSFISQETNIIKFDVDSRPGIIQIRKQIADLITDEDYFLGIDAHTVFSKNWDTTLISSHEKLKQITKNDKIVIGDRIINYNSEDMDKFLYIENRYILDAKDGRLDVGCEQDPRFIYGIKKDDDILFKKEYFVSANFWFVTTDYHKLNKFPDYHKSVCEEPEMSISLYCSGYDLFYPVNKNILYHRMSESNNPNNKIHYKKEFLPDGSERYVKNWNVDDYKMFLDVFLLMLTGRNKYWQYDTIRKPADYWSEIGLGKNYTRVLKALLWEKKNMEKNE
jgi:hypothetical protein